MQQMWRIGTFAAVLGSMISGSAACLASCGVPILCGKVIESMGGKEYISEFRNGDIAGVAGLELLSREDSSDRPKDGVLAMMAFNAALPRSCSLSVQDSRATTSSGVSGSRTENKREVLRS